MSDKNGFDIIRMREEDEFEDISSSFTDISSSSRSRGKPVKKKRKKKNVFLRTLCITFAVLIGVVLGFFIYAFSLIEAVERAELKEEDLGIQTNQYSDVLNIAFLGTDSRKDNDSGRSDAIVVVSINKKSNKIKLISIARDTYVSIDGRGKDKLTHAYAYGKAPLTVKTLNQNFDLEITDYVKMNFFEFANVIDYIGGVTVDVDEREMGELNTNIIPYLKRMGIKGKKIEKPGLQELSGGQALCYSRIRHTDSDVMRGNRQKEVLAAVLDKVKTISVTKLPKIAKMVLEECETTLSTADIMSIGAKAILSGMEFEELSIPNDNVDSSGQIISGVWYYVVNLEQAKTEIYDFIYDLNYYSPEAVAEREAEEKAKEEAAS